MPKKLTKENLAISILFTTVLVFVLSKPAIYSPDTYSFLRAMPQRHPLYVIFSKVLSNVIPNKSLFDFSIVLIQVLTGLLSVFIFIKKISSILQLNLIERLIIFALLLFPFFPPLSVANNICPEGLSYSFYLLFLILALDITIKKNTKHLIYFIGTYVLLALTRGQFIISTLIFIVPFLSQLKTGPFNTTLLKQLSIFILSPIFVILIDKSYHKLKDGYFKTTPYGFVNASALAFYVSNEDNSNCFQDKKEKDIFLRSIKTLDDKKLLMSNQNTIADKEKYYFFHTHVPPICNRTIHTETINFFKEKTILTNEKQKDAYALFNSEAALKNITLKLIKVNFQQWIRMYFQNMKYGFKSIFLLLFIIGVFCYSSIKLFYNYTKNYALLFIFSSLTLSNAVLVAFASHSIMRYLFYNYISILLIFILIFKLLSKNEKSI